jgi:hypothetical protein
MTPHRMKTPDGVGSVVWHAHDADGGGAGSAAEEAPPNEVAPLLDEEGRVDVASNDEEPAAEALAEELRMAIDVAPGVDEATTTDEDCGPEEGGSNELDVGMPASGAAGGVAVRSSNAKDRSELVSVFCFTTAARTLRPTRNAGWRIR